jgi:phosphoglycerate kinase
VQTEKMTVRDIEVGGKRVLVRVDFNVPLDEKGNITDDTRIRASLPTIEYLTDRGAKIILCSHLGRPKGKVVTELSLAPIAKHLAKLLGRPVIASRDIIGKGVQKVIDGIKSGDILLLENVRFHPGEEENDPAFAQALSRLANVYVDDAFGAVHRVHASTVGITSHLPAVAGLLLEKEIKTLGGILENPARPFVMITGGAKVSDKMAMIENILGKVESILVGGGMAANFLKARSYEVGKSAVEDDMLELTVRLMEDMEKRGIRLLLPVDVVVAAAISAGTDTKTVAVTDIPSQWQICSGT